MNELAGKAEILIQKPGFLKCVYRDNGAPFPLKPIYYIDLSHTFGQGDYGAGLAQAILEKKWVLTYFKMVGFTHHNGGSYAVWITSGR
jgi:hypothetical protein